MIKKVIVLLMVVNTVWAQNTRVLTHTDKHYKEGLYLYEKEKYGSSQKAFEKYLLTNPATPTAIEAKFYIAFADLYLYRPDAEFRLKELIALYPEHDKAVLAQFELGNFYYNKKSYDNAIAYFTLLQYDRLPAEKVTEAKFKSAYSFFSKKDFDAAGKYFGEIKYTQSKYYYAANYYSGYVNYKKANFDESLRDLKVAEQNEAYRNIVPEMIINVYYLQKNYDKVISYGDSTLKNNGSIKNKAEIRLLIADAYYYKENYPKAAENFAEFISSPKGIEKELAYRYAYSNYKSGKYEIATEYFKQIALNKDTIGQSAAYHLGLSYLKTNQKPYAIIAFEQAKNLTYDKEIQENATFYYAKLNFEQAKFVEAINSLKDFKKMYPESKLSQETNEILSESYLNTSNYAEAIRFIESLKTKSKRITIAYQRVTFLQGTLLFNDRKYDEAIKYFGISLEHPHDEDMVADANFWTGETYSVGKEYEKAIAAYQNVLKYGNKDSETYMKARYGIAYAYYNTKQYEKARPHLEEYIKHFESATFKHYYTDALLRLADCHYIAKRYPTSLEWYDRALRENNPEADYIYFQKGVIYFSINKYEESKSSFDYIVKNITKSRYYDDALFQLGEVDFLTGAYAPAISYFSEVIETSANKQYVPVALQKRAICNVNIKKYPLAITDYKRLLDEYSNSPQAESALLGLQEALAMDNRPEEFTPYLEKFKAANPQSNALESIEFESAKTLYNNENYAASAKAFSNYITSYPDKNQTIDARYYLADSYYRLKDNANALKYFKEVIEENKSDFINRSISKAAELEMTAGAYDNAAMYYSRLYKIARNKKEQASAEVGLIKSYYELGKLDTVMFYCNDLMTQVNNPIYVQNTVSLYAAKTLYAKGNYTEAIDNILNLLNSARDEAGAEATYILAEIYHKQEAYAQSIETLYGLVGNFASYPKWTNKAYLLIADNFVARKEYFQAKATLNSIVEKSSDTALVTAAKEKLKKIEEIEAPKVEETPVNNEQTPEENNEKQ